MPTYSYRCANCDYAFDQYQAFTDDSLTVCPNCGQPQLRKVFNSIGVTFNGSGFYHSDSGSGSDTRSTGSEKSKDTKPSDTGSGDTSSRETSSGKTEPTKTESTPKAEPKKAESKKAAPGSASS